MRIFFILLVILHGLIHLMGYAKAFKLAEIEALTQPISKPAGLLWLSSTLLFLLVTVLYILKKDIWWMAAMPAVILSQALIFQSWQDAKFGTIPNLIILLVTIVGFGGWQFQRLVRADRQALLASAQPAVDILTAERISSLPPIVQQWVNRSGVVGKPVIQTVHLHQSGTMRTTPEGKWMPVNAEQWFTTKKPGFLWSADVTAGPGIHLAGKDTYLDGRGHMLIKLLSLFPVADAKGEKTDQGTLLRYLAEIIWFPSAALEPYIQWEALDANSARATMTYGGVSAGGTFTFDENGDPVSFSAQRYYDRKGGATLEEWFIQMEPDGFREWDGIRIPARSAVSWKLKEGDFTWFRLEITGIEYNSGGN